MAEIWLLNVRPLCVFLEEGCGLLTGEPACNLEAQPNGIGAVDPTVGMTTLMAKCSYWTSHVTPA